MKKLLSLILAMMAFVIPSEYRMMNKYEGKEIDVCPLIKHDLDEFLYLHFLHKTGETC
ncbi:MAG: hypothetical protein K2M85_08825 [Paramuribaculum sp.]|nr:hypothetical protein [Bacteroides sp.]MDE7461161.1 hypothetical protein [Paramuribaculum sp.]